MGTIANVLHTAARPIATHEFAEALRAICPPRFAVSRNVHRRVALAVSGGVDSMALAYLCSRLRSHDPEFNISDNPVLDFYGIVVDHRLREGSREEANEVVNVLQKLGIRGSVETLSWSKVLGSYQHPKDMPNFESVARKLRYQRLGHVCGQSYIASLLFAHHQDDQHETVLMRLMQGHGARGLRGIKAATDIPECEGMHRVYQSGYIDDQRARKPFYDNRPPKRQLLKLRQELRSSISRLMDEQQQLSDDVDESDYYGLGDALHMSRLVPLDSSNLDVEDGGVMVYRPLLDFPKERLIATCEAYKVPWWEDVTNQDQTITLRNAVRHMVKHYNLPLALQKPSILDLSRRCEKRARALDAEATRLLSRTLLHDIEPNAGTASVQFPDYGPHQVPRDRSSRTRRRARIIRQREIAGLLIKRIIALVGPEEQTVPLANLRNVISWLFPALSLPEASVKRDMGSPKAFSIAGIHFTPIEPDPKRGSVPGLTWYLSRAPYPSNVPVPRFRTGNWCGNIGFGGCVKTEYNEAKWTQWTLWDGRFWIRLKHQLPYRVIVQPFAKEHAKPFREQLPPEDRDRLAALLKRYAPGKTRYTLPALYLEEELDLKNPRPRPYYPLPPSFAHAMFPGKAKLGSEAKADLDSMHPRILDVSKMKLLALPSLDIQIPELEDWLEYEIRFHRMDRSTLNKAGESFYSAGSSLSPRTYSSAPLSRKRRGEKGEGRWGMNVDRYRRRGLKRRRLRCRNTVFA